MPSDWQRWLSSVATGILALISVAVLYWARSLLIPIALAIFFTFVLSPLVAWLQHRGLGRTAAVVAVMLVALLVFAGIGSAIVHEMIVIAGTLPDRQEAIKEKLVAARSWLFDGNSDRFGQFIDEMEEVFFPKRRAQPTVVVEAPRCRCRRSTTITSVPRSSSWVRPRSPSS